MVFSKAAVLLVNVKSESSAFELGLAKQLRLLNYISGSIYILKKKLWLILFNF